LALVVSVSAKKADEPQYFNEKQNGFELHIDTLLNNVRQLIK